MVYCIIRLAYIRHDVCVFRLEILREGFYEEGEEDPFWV